MPECLWSSVKRKPGVFFTFHPVFIFFLVSETNDLRKTPV